MVGDQAYFLKQRELYVNFDRLLQFGRTSQEPLVRTEGTILQRSSKRFCNSGRVTSDGRLLTLSGPEYPSDGVVSSLSQILQDNVAAKYYLTPKACAGILRRAEKRGRALPPLLQAALESVASQLAEGEQAA